MMHDETSIEPENDEDIELYTAEEKQKMFSFMASSGLVREEIQDVLRDYIRWEDNEICTPDYVKQVEKRYEL